MSIQIAFRDSRSEMHGFEMKMAIGVVEVDGEYADLAEDNLVPAKLNFNDDGHLSSLKIIDGFSEVTDRYREDVEMSSIDRVLILPIERIVPNELFNAQFLMRKTRINPTSHKSVVMSFCGLVGITPSENIDYKKITHLQEMASGNMSFSFAGHLGVDINPELGNVDAVKLSRGMNFDGILGQAVWGFDGRPVALQSTLKLELLDKIDRHKILYFKDRSPAEEQEYKSLSDELNRMGLAIHLNGEHIEFEEFSKKLIERGVDINSSKPMSNAELDIRARTASEILREIQDKHSQMKM